jgi:hypothetical protein
VDFADIPSEVGIVKSYEYAGFTIAAAPPLPTMVVTRGNRRTICVAPNGWGPMSIARTDGAPFQVYSVDLASNQAYSVVISGDTPSGVLTKAVNLTGYRTLYATAILDWSDVRKMTFAWYSGPNGSGRPRAGEINSFVLNTHRVEKVADPVASMPSGEYPGPITVKLSCAIPDAEIYYTTNGSPPVRSGTPYKGTEISIHSSIRLRAWAYAPVMQSSEIASYEYCIGTPAAPVISEQTRELTYATEPTAKNTVLVKARANPNPDYQWQCKFPTDADYRDIAGANYESYGVRFAKNDTSCLYRVIVRNMAGQVISDPIPVTVKAP